MLPIHGAEGKASNPPTPPQLWQAPYWHAGSCTGWNISRTTGHAVGNRLE